MKSHNNLDEMADRIAGKHYLAPVVLNITDLFDSNWDDTLHPAAEIAGRIHDRHQIENLVQGEKITDALDNARTQMLVREYHRPEYFIWSLELKEDEASFGFTRQARQNKLTKLVPEITFCRASERLYDFFATKLRVHTTDISALSKREE